MNNNDISRSINMELNLNSNEFQFRNLKNIKELSEIERLELRINSYPDHYMNQLNIIKMSSHVNDKFIDL